MMNKSDKILQNNLNEIFLCTRKYAVAFRMENAPSKCNIEKKTITL